MQAIQTYLYSNKIVVQILDTTIFKVRNRQVYSRPIKIYQGIDNPIQVVIKNQDQKAVNFTGYIMQADIQDPVNKVTAESIAVIMSNIALGQGSFIINSDIANNLENRFYKLTFKTIRVIDNAESPAYVDDNYGVPLDLEVLPAYYATTSGTPGVIETVLDGGTIL